MLAASVRQGIAHVAATPHFYPSEISPERFLDRRNQAAERLQTAWQPELPRLLLGAEVYYFEGISRAAEVEALRIEGTSLLLLEMPFHTWSDRMLEEVRVLHNRPGCTVMLAHIERYLRFQKRAVWDKLLEAGILMQSNASFFLRWNTKRKAIHMFDDGQIHFMGSDCHNMTERPPRMKEALSAIGEQRVRILEQRCRELLDLGEAVD